MKKIIIGLLFVISSSAITQAQINIGTVGGTIGGVPVSVNFNKTTTAGQVSGGPLLQLLNLAQTLVSRLVPFMIGLALIAFFWYLIQFIWKGDESPEKRQAGLKGMGYSILALFVMVSIWGIIGVLGNILGTPQGGGIPSLEMPKAK